MLLVFIYLSVFVFHAVENKSERPSIVNRIVNGVEVKPCDKYHFQVNFMTRYTSCGGSLITQWTVLTAGHCAFPCIDEADNGDCMQFKKVYHATVHVGGFLYPGYSTTCSNQKGPMCTYFGRKREGTFIHHPDYNPPDLNEVPDIALVNLKRKVRTKHGFICLPGGPRDFSKHIATVIGWGSTQQYNEGDDYEFRETSVLLETELDVLTDEACAEASAYVDEELCAFRESTDSCQGDSGGPLFIAEDDIYLQIGIVSSGLGCADTRGYPGRYTRVTSQLDWIRNNMKGEEPEHCLFDDTSHSERSQS